MRLCNLIDAVGDFGQRQFGGGLGIGLGKGLHEVDRDVLRRGGTATGEEAGADGEKGELDDGFHVLFRLVCCFGVLRAGRRRPPGRRRNGLENALKSINTLSPCQYLFRLDSTPTIVERGRTW